MKILLIYVLSTSVYSMFDGAYVGINGSLINYKEQLIESIATQSCETFTVNPPPAASPPSAISRAHTKQSSRRSDYNYAKTASGLGLFCGYGKGSPNKLWTAVDIHYNVDSLHKKERYADQSSTTITNLRSNGNWSTAIHLGYVPNNCYVAYFILGGSMRIFSFKEKIMTPSQEFYVSKAYRRFFICPGIGARFALSKDFSFKCEYLHNIGRNKTQLNVFNCGILCKV